VAPLAVAAGLIFVQFVLIGAGKPAEYGRFGIFTNSALVIATACGLTGRWTPRREWINWLVTVGVAGWVGLFGCRYLLNFVADAGERSTRILAARTLASQDGPIGLLAEPAPYCCPPLDFAAREVWLFASVEDWAQRLAEASPSEAARSPHVLVATQDRPVLKQLTGAAENGWELLPSGDRQPPLSPISWANKPVCAWWATPASAGGP
jgi:hypothetical protein